MPVRPRPLPLVGLLVPLAALALVAPAPASAAAPAVRPGAAQSAGTAPTVSGSLPSPLQAGTEVTDGYAVTGDPAPVVTVTDGALPPGLGISETGAVTGTPTTAGTYRYTVTATNEAGSSSTTDTVTVLAGPASRVAAVSGDYRSAPVETAYAAPLVVRTTDAYGNPVSGVTVRFAAPGTGPSATFAGRRTQDRVSDADGLITSSVPVANRTAGTYVVTVAATGLVGLDLPLTNVPLPLVSVVDRVLREGDGGARAVVFAVTLNRRVDVPVSVHWSTGDGTATSPSDYTASSGTVTVAPGDQVALVRVPVVADHVAEPDERFVLTISDPVAGRLGTPTGTATLLDDDA